MYGKRFPIFKLLGFEVKIELSWLILAALMIWSLASNVFPSNNPGLSRAAYLWMGVAGALGLFASIVFHELCHSLVARRYGLPITGITLFIFGGVAEMEDEPPSARSEFLMALAGPASSALLALGFYAGTRSAGGMGQGSDWLQAVQGVLRYLASLNVSLAGFNLLPAFPLDGGRVLRAILWGWRRDLWWATRITSRIGSGFGVAMVGLGVLSLFLGNFVSGLWLFVIGTFLQNASRTSYQRLLLQEALQGQQVQRFMKPEPVTVSPSISVGELVEDYIYRYHFKMFPVIERGALVGCVSTRTVREVPQAEWSRRTVGDLVRECSLENTISPTADAMDALAKMNRTGNSRLMVVDSDRLVGVITLKDMLEFLSLKVELERSK